MRETFDAYETTYAETVQQSIAFSGLEHAFFLRAKADILEEVIADRLKTRDGLTLMDVGCGIGAMHPHLRRLFSGIEGVDVSSACIEQARKANPWARYDSYGGETLPKETATFDLSLATCVMHHVPVAQWQSLTIEMARVVRPGGLVCFIEHNPLNPMTRLAVARCEFDRDAVLLRSGTSERLMAGAGLTNIETRFFLTMPSERGWARRIEHGLARLPLGAQYITFGQVA